MTSDRRPALIALDWGTSSLRAYLLDSCGQVLESKQTPKGIMHIEKGSFARIFDDVTGVWRQRAPRLPAIAAGMIGSAQGWINAPYVPCPAGPEELAAGLVTVPDQAIVVVPGVMQTGAAPNVMRGEETQIAGALALRPEHGAHMRLVLPGTHSKWVEVGDGRIRAFTTYMTGELFAVLRSHSILGRLAGERAAAPAAERAAFLRGVDAARGADGIAPLLFSTRALVLTGGLAAEESLDYLSGLLIGEELRSARVGTGDALLLIGDPALCARYTLALSQFGVTSAVEVEDAAVAGLWRIAVAAGLVEAAKEEEL